MLHVKKQTLNIQLYRENDSLLIKSEKKYNAVCKEAMNVKNFKYKSLYTENE